MNTRNIIDLIVLAAAWGASYLFMRISVPEFGVLALIEVRVIIAALFLLPIWLARSSKQQKSNTRQEFRRIIIVGLLNSAIPFSLIAYSTLFLTGGFAAIINATTPLWGAVIAWLWLREYLTKTAFLGLALGFLGVVILVWDTIVWSFSGATLAIFAGLLASFFYGIAANYTRKTLTKSSPLSIATFSQVSAAIILLPFAISNWPTHNPSLFAWCAVIAMGVFSTGIAYILYFRLIANLGSTKAVTVTFLIPVFATIWGMVFIDESITMNMVIGSAIILTGTAWTSGIAKVKFLEKN